MGPSAAAANDAATAAAAKKGDAANANTNNAIAAIAILRDTTWCKNFSDELLEAMASKMTLVVAKDGRIFVNEGEEMRYFMILEEGTLVRTKLSLDYDDSDTVKAIESEIDGMERPSEVWRELEEKSVVVDKITGRGRMPGILHSLVAHKKAYATTVARGDCRVWLLSGEDFREIVQNNASFSWQFLLAMSEEVRTGSKSMEALIRRVRGVNADPDGGDGVQDCLRVLCYDATSWTTESFKPAVDEFNSNGVAAKNGFHIVMDYTTDRLCMNTATHAAGYDAVCTFVNDSVDADAMQTLSFVGAKMIAQRAAGFDRIDLKAARAYGMTVARVPAYSPYAVAEHAITLLMSVNRKIHRATSRVRMANFSLDGGLMGMDIHGKTVGVMGTGKIGQILCRIISGFGVANLLCYDVFESDAVKELGGTYVETKDELYERSDVIFLMMPLLETTYHTINRGMLPKLKRGVILINTSRGGLVDTVALLEGLRAGIISGVGLDVYENEGEYFFQDWSGRQLKDPHLAILLGLNNVIMTAHQAFFTKEAVDEIVKTTIQNLVDFKNGLTGPKHPNNVIPALPSSPTNK